MTVRIHIEADTATEALEELRRLAAGELREVEGRPEPELVSVGPAEPVPEPARADTPETRAEPVAADREAVDEEPGDPKPAQGFTRDRTRPAYYITADGNPGYTYSSAELEHLKRQGAKQVKKPEYEAALVLSGESSESGGSDAKAEPAQALAGTPKRDTDAGDGYPEFDGIKYLKHPEDGRKYAAKTFSHMKALLDDGWVVISKEEYERPEQFKAEQADNDSEGPTREDVHAALKALTGAKGMHAGLELLQRFDARRLSELQAGDYASFIEACKAATA